MQLFYIFGIMISIYNIVLYAIFRGGIYDYLRLSKMSKKNINKHRKGFKNYWLYVSINHQTPLGILYYLNIIFLVSTIAFSVLAVALCFIKVLQPVVFACSILLCIIEIPTVFLASVYSYKAEFGTPFVLFARRKLTGKFCSSLIDMFSWCITAFLIYLSYFYL